MHFNQFQIERQEEEEEGGKKQKKEAKKWLKTTTSISPNRKWQINYWQSENQ